MSDFEIEDEDPYNLSSWNKKSNNKSKSNLFAGNDDDNDAYDFDFSSKSKYSANKKSPTRMSHDFVPKEYNKEKNKAVSGVSKSTSAIDDTTSAMDRAASLLAKYDKGASSTSSSLSRTVSTKKLPSRFDEDDISIDDDEFVNEDEIDMSASYDSKTLKKKTTVKISKPVISKSNEKPISVATSKAVTTTSSSIASSTFSKPEYLGNIKGIDELEASISMDQDYADEASQSYQQSSQKSYISNTNEIIEDMDDDDDDENDDDYEESNDKIDNEPISDERETPKIVSFADFNTVTGWTTETDENDNRNVSKGNKEQSLKASKLSDNSNEVPLPSYSKTEPVPAKQQQQQQQYQQQQQPQYQQQQPQYQPQQQPQQQQQQQQYYQPPPQPHVYPPQPYMYPAPPASTGNDATNQHPIPNYYPPMYSSYPPPYYAPPPIHPLSSLDATSHMSGMGYPFMSTSQQFFQRSGLGSYHQPVQSSNVSDPVVLDLLRELKQAKDDAAWAKNRLAEMITLINKKGSNKLSRSDLAREMRRSKSPIADDDYADEEYEEYSADFEGSQLNISQETIKSQLSYKVKNEEIKQRQQPLKYEEDTKHTIPTKQSKESAELDLGHTTSISGLNLGDAYQTSRALFRHQLEFIRERITHLATNKPTLLPGSKASSSVPSLQELKEQFEKKRIENSTKIHKLLMQANPSLDEKQAKHLAAKFNV